MNAGNAKTARRTRTRSFKSFERRCRETDTGLDRPKTPLINGDGEKVVIRRCQHARSRMERQLAASILV